MDIKKFLSNTQMGRVVANFLKKELTTDAQGRVQLSEEDERELTEHFGAGFVQLLKEKSFATEDEKASNLYEAAVRHATEQVETKFTEQIAQLQKDIATFAAKP